MSETASDYRPAPTAAAADVTAVSSTNPADQPIPLWPEGAIALIAGIALVAIGLRHRLFLQRKAREVQRMVDEFQRQGGVDEIRHVAQQAAELLKGATG